ncbi:hypothetical protein MHB47_13240 [Staphylococcus sp. FSL K6-3157]|uniref:hypothetical protein n=1 Tax=Staphylococcus sp. FSL K6-3157 TaxID=2921490 RepID=UPI0030F8F8A4
MNQQKLEELNRLAKGTEKEKKIALTFGYQPIIEELKKDDNKEISDFAQTMDANEDLKLYKNNVQYKRSKEQFQKDLKQATQYMYATLILIGIAVVSIFIAVIIFFVNPVTTVTPFITITVIAMLGSLVTVILSKRTGVSYNNSKQSLAKSVYLLNISRSNSQSLQAQINNNE